MIQARVNGGIARAKGGGKHCGRPPLAPELAERIRQALAVLGRPGIGDRRAVRFIANDDGAERRAVNTLDISRL